MTTQKIKSKPTNKKVKREKITYIKNLEASYIVRALIENQEYKVPDIAFSKLYSCSLADNMDLLKIEKINNREIRIPESYMDANQHTDALINITFDKSIKDENGKKIYTTKQTREYLYKNGFTIDNVDYVFYKRSSSKAREGSALFIKKKLHKKMMNWSRLGIDFIQDEEVDITSLMAYESLTLSSIEKVVGIRPHEILLIDDCQTQYKSIASVTELDNDNKIKTETKEITGESDIWDGQSLACESLFRGNKQNKSMMLLRNQFFKSAAFSTNIKQFFADNGIEKVTDMFGKEMTADKIKLITTPNSLKFLKFAYKFNSKEECYKHWLKHSENAFGICKSEKESRYGQYQSLSYQMINSMPFSREDIAKLMEEEVEYINLLKNDLSVFRHHIRINDLSPARDLIYNILAINSEISKTPMFKSFKNKTVQDYIDKVRQGKIKIPNADYAVMIGNPYEMLLGAIGKQPKQSLHKGKQVYCPMFKDGEELVLMRNPHICSGNVMTAQNKYHDEFKYFNLSDNTVIINAFDNDALERLQGADYDSDTALISNNPLLLQKAKECEVYPTPVNAIKAVKTRRYYNAGQMAEVDHLISQNLIGHIVNQSQIHNSNYWDIYNQKGNNNADVLDDIYSKVSMLSSLSQIEIDKAKKFIDKETLNINKVLDNIKKSKYLKKFKYKIKIDKVKTIIDKGILNINKILNNIKQSENLKIFDVFVK
ncbi:hypothetical protein GGQ84_001882 [Desulfitispora alkaliphila]|uniref:hypothetical protein n=1 Tax=Desulfitispora alkaliphila TaxID=622674 RepID=UPI003D1D3220